MSNRTPHERYALVSEFTVGAMNEPSGIADVRTGRELRVIEALKQVDMAFNSEAREGDYFISANGLLSDGAQAHNSMLRHHIEAGDPHAHDELRLVGLFRILPPQVQRGQK